MHPITATHDWIVGHPIAFALILFAIGLPVSVYAAEVKAFLRLPPQKLGRWILKSRIIANEAKLNRWKRITAEPQYALYLLMAPAGMFGMLILLFLLEIYGMLTIPGNIVFAKHSEPALFSLTLAVLFVVIYTFLDFRALFQYENSLEALVKKIARLKAKLPSA